MYTPVQVTFYHTKNILAEIGTEIQSNQIFFIVQKGKHVQRKLFPVLLVFFNNCILITFNYLSSTCVELIFTISRIKMTSTFTTLAKFIKIFLIHMQDH